MDLPSSAARLRFFLFSVVGFFLFFGCEEKNNEAQQITLKPVPVSLAIDSSNQGALVENLTHSILIGDIEADSITWTGQLYKSDWSFVPWGVEAGGQPPNEILFVSGYAAGGTPSSKLLALPAQEPIAEAQNEHGNYNVLKVSKGISEEDPFTSLRGVASFTVNDIEEIIRVFLIDDLRIVVFDFDYDKTVPTDSTFDYQYTISTLALPCTGGGDDSDAFVEPLGLAVDPEERALYVTDFSINKLYRFTGIAGSSATCAGEISAWGDPENSLSDPAGIAVLAGQTPSSDNLIYVADYTNARVVVFKWNGSAFIWNHTISLSDKKPFDLALDADDNLWSTYPASHEYGKIDEAGP